MSDLSNIFEELEKLVETENVLELMKIIMKGNFNLDDITEEAASSKYSFIKNYLMRIISVIDLLILEIAKDEELIISVKNRKLLRTCYELLVSLGISRCLIPGLGISLEKRCISAKSFPKVMLNDDQKYEILVFCTEFFQRSYKIPALKSIIISYYLSDYLAALVLLAFAPLKEPGVYPRYTMTQSKYDKLKSDQQRFKEIYEFVVNKCFQPLVMKELLVLQSVKEPSPPLFVKKVLSNEMSKRLTAPNGLSSLVRCLMDCDDMDTGMEWSKINVICKILVAKHNHMNEKKYLENIVSQLKEILSLDSLQYLNTGIACLLTLQQKHHENELILNLVNEVFNTLNFDQISKSKLPNTIILTTQEIRHNIKFFQGCSTIMAKLDIPSELILPNLYMLFLLRVKCTTDETKSILSDIIIKSLEILNDEEFENIVEKFLFGPEQSESSNVLIEEYEAGLVVKCSASRVEHPRDEAYTNFLEIFNAITENKLVAKIFELSFKIFVKSNSDRKWKNTTETLPSVDEGPRGLSTDQSYVQMLHLLAEMSASERVTNALKENPCIVVYFVESLLFGNVAELNDECSTIALVLLNTVLPSVNKTKELEIRLQNLVPILEKLANDASECTKILCKESISLIANNCPKSEVSAYDNALAYAVDKLLPVRAHGIIELTKLIEKADPEALSRRHYLFCLFQDQLRDSDSYLYLAAINGLAAISMCCPSEALAALCKEFLYVSNQQTKLLTTEHQNKIIELRLKVGDIIVKVIKKLGQLAVVHKVVLLNTMLCACRDDEPLIRASALSNVAEIALVMNYRMGTIIYEVLDCIWGVIETETVVECRRAAVMVITSLFKGLGKDMLFQLKENLLPIYRTLNRVYKDTNEDSVVKLHAQLALEELNDIVRQFLTPDLQFEKDFVILSKDDIILK